MDRVGDIVDTLMAFIIFWNCCEVEQGLPGKLKLKMAGIIALDLFLGLVPILGDVVDAMFQSNIEMARRLERHLGVTNDGEKGRRRGTEPGHSVTAA